MFDSKTEQARAVLREVPTVVGGACFTDAEEPELKAVLAEVRAAQRCLDGVVIGIGIRSNQLAGLGKSTPAEQTVRGGGMVGAYQARKEATRATIVEHLPVLGDAISTGQISGEHIDAIARHARKLTEEQRAGFDFASLVAAAAGLAPETFDRQVKRRVEHVVADHGLTDTTTKQTASEFRHWVDQDTGMGRFAGALDPERYEMLVNAIDQHTTTLASQGGTPKTKNLAAQALVELVTATARRDTRNRVPTILVVVDHTTLTDGPHSGSVRQTETGHDIAAQSVARLCCDAILRRVTLDDRGVPLDVGRKHRTATDAQWAALKTIHTTCAWDTCTAPISWCQAHHITEWENGGQTDLDNLIPLCSRHHHRVHEGRWHIKLLPDRTLKIYKPNGTHHTTVPTPQRC